MYVLLTWPQFYLTSQKCAKYSGCQKPGAIAITTLDLQNMKRSTTMRCTNEMKHKGQHTCHRDTTWISSKY